MAQERSNADRPAFWVVVEDHQAKVFTVLGPLAEDGEWAAKAKVARERGRDVTISTVASELDVRAMTRNLAEHGFAGSELPIL